jgi:hypothetical protein
MREEVDRRPSTSDSLQPCVKLQTSMKRCMAGKSFERLDEGVCWEPSTRRRHQDAFHRGSPLELGGLIVIPRDNDDGLKRKYLDRVEGGGDGSCAVLPGGLGVVAMAKCRSR